MLDELEIETIGKIIALTADYDGIDDLLRLSSRYRSRQIIVPKQCSAALREVCDRMDSLNLTAEITVFANQYPPAGHGRRCYRPGEAGVWVEVDNMEVLICHKLLPNNRLPQKCGSRRMLVIGQPWNVTEDVLLELGSAGFQSLFCSKLEQRIAWPAADNPLVEVQDLNAAGTLSLDLK